MRSSTILTWLTPVLLTCCVFFFLMHRRAFTDRRFLLPVVRPTAGCKEALNLNDSVLVTGAAGFIGFALCSQLATQGIANIMGLDSFNSYYDPALKRARALQLLENHGVPVLDGDVCNATLLRSLFDRHKFTHIVHFAAQAGARHSLQFPLRYVRENVQCFTVLMEEILWQKRTGVAVPHLTFASSSSVYGLNTKIPFAETDLLDRPANFYGATKLMDEIIALTYFNLWNISSVGLRFFTVYGPWGRPDMSPFIFTQRIAKGQYLTIFDEGKMLRDFTYVDDVVLGIQAAMQYRRCEGGFQPFNLGNNQPLLVSELVRYIELELNKTAKVKYAVSHGEMPVTYASIDLAKQQLGYSPTTSLQQGIKQFVAWYQWWEAHPANEKFYNRGGNFTTVGGSSCLGRPVIMTTWFFSRNDPQRPNVATRRDSKYISSWYSSVKKLGLCGVVFHDHLDGRATEFASVTMEIVYVDLNSYRSRSLNDVRFFVYRDYLARKKIQPPKVFMTDGADVVVVQDPFRHASSEECLYIGGIKPNPNRNNKWIKSKLQQIKLRTVKPRAGLLDTQSYDDILDFDTVNAGVIGGSISVVERLLDHITAMLDTIEPGYNANMGVVNLVVWRLFPKQAVRNGPPLVSRFFQYETGRADVVFIHK